MNASCSAASAPIRSAEGGHPEPVLPHDVTDFGRELRIDAELERLNAVRLQVVFAPNALYGRWAQSLLACQFGTVLAPTRSACKFRDASRSVIRPVRRVMLTT
jgi:hypothetical protein